MSLRNVAPRRSHQERSQPRNRAHLGLLEHHKDYVVRARDYHKKERRLKSLREKALNRNPDEFNTKMITSKTKDGVHVKEHEGKVLSAEEMVLLRSQDSNYLALQMQSNRKKIEGLKAEVSLDFAQPQKQKHIVFLDDEKEVKHFKATKYFRTPPELLKSQTFNLLREDQLEKGSVVVGGIEPSVLSSRSQIRKTMANLAKEKQKTLSELKRRQEREKKLEAVYHESELKRNLLKKGPREKVKTDTGFTYRWKAVRKS